MSEYTSILSCLSTSASSSHSDVKTEESLKEVSDIVEDLMMIQNKEMLKRNLTNLVTENVALKSQLKELKAELESARESSKNMSFLIDCDGGMEDDTDNNDKVQYNDNQISVVLGEVNDKSTSETPKVKGNACFNCGETHILSDCPHPRDQARINKNRREFANNNATLSSAR